MCDYRPSWIPPSPKLPVKIILNLDRGCLKWPFGLADQGHHLKALSERQEGSLIINVCRFLIINTSSSVTKNPEILSHGSKKLGDLRFLVICLWANLVKLFVAVLFNHTNNYFCLFTSFTMVVRGATLHTLFMIQFNIIAFLFRILIFWFDYKWWSLRGKLLILH